MVAITKTNKQEMIEAIYKVIWRNQPIAVIMIDDVLEYCFSMCKPLEQSSRSKSLKIYDYFWWWSIKKPIEEQSDECIEFVYNLIQ